MICKVARHFSIFSLALPVAFSFCNKTFAQSEGGANQATYRSETDELLSLDKVSVLPFSDNLQGIYSRPLEADFVERVNAMHRWDLAAVSGSGPVLSPEELEAAPDKAKRAVEGISTDGFFAARISKGPNGVTMHLSLFLAKDGRLLAQAVLKDYKQFQLEDLKNQSQRLLTEIVSRLPYSGRILSRDGNRVTVNLGTRDGLQPNQVLSVIQIIKAHRHPKMNFLVKTEKEVLGKVKVLKVDETLSFGVIATEKEKNAIQKNAKIGPLDFVAYTGAQEMSLTSEPEDALSQRQDGPIAYGKDARAWKPETPASFGQIGGRFGLGQFNGNTNISTGPLDASNRFAPHVQIDGEIWVTPELTFAARLRQGIVPVSNPRDGSSPADLNQSMSYYDATAAYRIRLGPYIWSPHVEPFVGYFSYKLYVDDTEPRAFTTMQYTGLKFGVRGSTPIGGDRGIYGVGGEFAMGFKPGLRETPVSSGSSSENNFTQFGVFGFKKMSERLKLLVGIDFEMYSSTFSGAGTRTETVTSSSQRHTNFSAGLYYLF